MDQAAVACLHETANNDGLEHGGLIVKYDYGYSCAGRVTGTDNQLHIWFLPELRDKIVAMYHTHPAGQNEQLSAYFSQEDISAAKQLHVASYILVVLDGSVHKWVPGRDGVEYSYVSGQLMSLGKIIK
jgi:hypothetical protein